MRESATQIHFGPFRNAAQRSSFTGIRAAQRFLHRHFGDCIHYPLEILLVPLTLLRHRARDS